MIHLVRSFCYLHRIHYIIVKSFVWTIKHTFFSYTLLHVKIFMFILHSREKSKTFIHTPPLTMPSNKRPGAFIWGLRIYRNVPYI